MSYASECKIVTVTNDLGTPSTALTRSVFISIANSTFPTLWLWMLTLSIIGIDAIWIFASPRISFTFDGFDELIAYWAAVPVLVFISSQLGVARYPIFTKIIYSAMILFFMIPTLMAIGILNHLVMTLPVPLTDDMLANLDQKLGLNWSEYAYALAHFDFVSTTMFRIYNGLMPAILLVALEAVIVSDYQRCKEFLTLIVTALVFTVLLASFFPATGAMDRFADAHLKSLFPEGSGTYFITQLLEVRGGDPLLIDPARLTGLSSVPSFHTIACILLIYGSRGHPVRSPVITVLAIIIIAATPVYGGHYFVDIIAGAIVAVFFIMMNLVYRERQQRHLD
jgi:PAP2 superfamily